MAEKNQGIDWSTLWKKDDWMSVWIGFLILIIFMAGATMRMPGWRWMTDGSVAEKMPGWQKTAEALVKQAEEKGEEGLKADLAALKTALDAKDRKAIGEAAGKVEKAVKEVKDKDLKGKADKLVRDTRGDVGASLGKTYAGDNLSRAFYLWLGLVIICSIGLIIMNAWSASFIWGFLFMFILSGIAFLIAGNTWISYIGLEVVFWALIFGLILSNFIGVTFFKTKWGGTPFLPYTFCSYSPGPQENFEALLQKL